MSFRPASIALAAILAGLGFARLAPGEFTAGTAVVPEAKAAPMSRA
jgi:hypothetical protein